MSETTTQDASKFDEHKSMFIAFLKKAKAGSDKTEATNADFMLKCFERYMAPMLEETNEELADTRDQVEEILDQLQPVELQTLEDTKTALVMAGLLIGKIMNASGFVDETKAETLTFTDKCPKDIVEDFMKFGDFNADLLARVDEQIEDWKSAPDDGEGSGEGEPVDDKNAA